MPNLEAAPRPGTRPTATNPSLKRIETWKPRPFQHTPWNHRTLAKKQRKQQQLALSQCSGASKPFGGIKERSARKCGDGLFACIDDIRVFFTFVRERPHPKHAVLTLEFHLYVISYEIRLLSRDPNPQVDVVSVLHFLGYSSGNTILV